MSIKIQHDSEFGMSGIANKSKTSSIQMRFRSEDGCIYFCAQWEIAGCTPQPSEPSIDCTGFEILYLALILLVS